MSTKAMVISSILTMATIMLATMATHTTLMTVPGTGMPGTGAAKKQRVPLQITQVIPTSQDITQHTSPSTVGITKMLLMVMDSCTTRMATSTPATMVTHTTMLMELGTGMCGNGAANTILFIMQLIQPFITMVNTTMLKHLLDPLAPVYPHPLLHNMIGLMKIPKQFTTMVIYTIVTMDTPTGTMLVIFHGSGIGPSGVTVVDERYDLHS